MTCPIPWHLAGNSNSESYTVDWVSNSLEIQSQMAISDCFQSFSRGLKLRKVTWNSGHWHLSEFRTEFRRLKDWTLGPTLKPISVIVPWPRRGWMSPVSVVGGRRSWWGGGTWRGWQPASEPPGSESEDISTAETLLPKCSCLFCFMKDHEV